MTNYELVSKFAETIREKCKDPEGDIGYKYAAAFGQMTGTLDTLVDRFPEVRRFIEDQLEQEKP